jgi:hypothetical protein
MRRLFLIATSMVLLGCSPSLAQIVAMPGTTAAPIIAPAPAAAAGNTNATPPAGTPGTALGSIHLNLASPLSGGGTGSISTCTANGFAGAASNFPVDETDPTAGATPGFDASETSATCSAPSPPPAIGPVSGSVFSSGAVPLSATEAGGSGLSPLIAGPFPTAPAASCSDMTTTGTATSGINGTFLTSGC